MTTTHTIALAEAIQNQSHGIILVWKHYLNGEANNSGVIYEFIPKYQIVLGNGLGHTSFLVKSSVGFGIKYIYIHNDKITGHDQNDDSGAIGGVTFNNANFVLSAVLGV